MSGAPTPVLLSLTITPKTEADAEKLRQALHAFAAEEPAWQAKLDDTSGQAVIAAMTDVGLEGLIDRLRRQFGVEADIGPLQIAYKETATKAANGDGRFVSQRAGRGQYGHVKINLYPGEPGSGRVVEDRNIGGLIPKQFIKPAEDGIRDALARGVVAGYPMDDVRVELYDGSYHEADSSELAFKIAGAMAFQDAARRAQPVLLEPVMRVEVVVPEEYAGVICNDLSYRRAGVLSREDRVATRIITAVVPLAEMIGYAGDLRLETYFKGTYSMSFDSYQPRELADSDDPGPQSAVAAPRRPTQPIRTSAVALPEPDPDDPAN